MFSLLSADFVVQRVYVRLYGRVSHIVDRCMLHLEQYGDFRVQMGGYSVEQGVGVTC